MNPLDNTSKVSLGTDEGAAAASSSPHPTDTIVSRVAQEAILINKELPVAGIEAELKKNLEPFTFETEDGTVSFRSLKGNSVHEYSRVVEGNTVTMKFVQKETKPLPSPIKPEDSFKSKRSLSIIIDYYFRKHDNSEGCSISIKLKENPHGYLKVETGANFPENTAEVTLLDGSKKLIEVKTTSLPERGTVIILKELGKEPFTIKV